MSQKEDLIRQMQHKQALTLDELIAEACRLIPVFIKAQKRYKVSNLPDKRTMRYYLREGLIDPPAGYQRRFAIFGERHLLQLLVLKYLQSQYIPLKKIARILKPLSTDDLKQILLSRARLEEGLLGQGRLTDAPETGAATKQLTAAGSGRTRAGDWHEFAIHDQVELHVKSGFNLLDQGPKAKEIIYNIMAALSGRASPPQIDSLINTDGLIFDEFDIGYEGPALPLKDRQTAVIALITEGGLVPAGNPARLGIPAVTSMFAQNPGADLYKKDLYIIETAGTAIGMQAAMPRMVDVALKLHRGIPIGPPAQEGYIPRGIRKNIISPKRASQRGIEMLLKKITANPFESEIALPRPLRWRPAPPIRDLPAAEIAMVTEGALFPKGNPDHMLIGRGIAAELGTASVDGAMVVAT